MSRKGWWLALAAMVVLAVWLLARLPRPLAAGLGVVIAAFLLAGLWFRQRDFGQYFEFKALAFSAEGALAQTAGESIATAPFSSNSNTSWAELVPPNGPIGRWLPSLPARSAARASPLGRRGPVRLVHGGRVQ